MRKLVFAKLIILNVVTFLSCCSVASDLIKVNGDSIPRYCQELGIGDSVDVNIPYDRALTRLPMRYSIYKEGIREYILSIPISL